jgi:predicted glycosyltransferase involved in capsule biosynthesis
MMFRTKYIQEIFLEEINMERAFIEPYCAVIRTLGTAGEKFEKEIASLLAQNTPPDKIIAYIPDGYKIPRFSNSEKVEWVRSPKGMITQRSLPFDEVTTEWILFLDDDVYLSPDSVEKLFEGIAQEKGDA